MTISDSIFQKPRIEIVDALRGLALFGLFIIHCHEYFDLYWMKPEPNSITNAVFFVFMGKAYAMFAMLFGLSFYIIMDRQAQKGINFTSRFAWRLTILLAIGTLHTLLYLGDILQILALVGLVLLFINRLKTRTILLISLLCAAQLPLWYKFIMAILDMPGANDQPLHWSLFGGVYSGIANGSFLDVLSINIWDGAKAKWAFMLESGRVTSIVTLFMFGLLLGRTEFFYKLRENASFRQKAFFITLALSIIFYVTHDYVKSENLFSSHAMAKYYLEKALDSYRNMAMMLFGTLGFIYLYEVAVLSKGLNLLAPCGRMSLTMYLLQSVVFVPLFYPYGLGWHKTLGQTNAFFVGIVSFALMMLFAHLWMKRFQYGPAEWLWRVATYLTWNVPFVRSK